MILHVFYFLKVSFLNSRFHVPLPNEEIKVKIENSQIGDLFYVVILLVMLRELWHFRIMCLWLWLHQSNIEPCRKERLMHFTSCLTQRNRSKHMFLMVWLGIFFFFFKCLCGKIEAQDYLELVVLLYRPKWGSVISLHVFIEMVVNFCFSVLVACIAQKSFLQSH